MRLVFSALLAASLSLVVATLAAPTAQADDADVLAIHGDISRQEFGSGTGVIVGIVDSGVAFTHPALSGTDSLGQPRLVAAQDFVGDGDTSATDIAVDGHGTAMASAILSSDPTHTGLAPDARYVDARVLDSNAQFFGDNTVMNGIGYAVSQGVNVMNLSLNFSPPSNNTGTDRMDLILDWAAGQGVNITVSAGNIAAHRDPTTGGVVLDENPPAPVRSPGSAYNVITVGRTGVPPGDPLGPINSSTVLNYNQVFINSASGPINSSNPTGISDRDKPDLVAPGTNITLANNNFVPGVPSTDWTTGLNGTSISSALVSGVMAQQVGYGMSHGLSTSPLVIKATMLNSADQVLNKDGSAWTPRAASMVGSVLQVTAPLDTDSGAGQINGARLFQQYSAGQHGVGSVPTTGWDLGNISGVATNTYTLSTPQIAGSQINVSLDWLRHVTWTDSNQNGVADSSDTFTAQTLDDLNLSVLINGSLVAESISTIDNEQFLEFLLPQSGIVSIQVNELLVAGAPMAEQYGLAWNVSTVPEPSAFLLATCAATMFGIRRWRNQQKRLRA